MRCLHRLDEEVFREEAESVLVRYIICCCTHYYGLSITDLRQVAYQFAKKIGAKYSPCWDEDLMASRSWYYGFKSRHKELSVRTPENTSKNRVAGFCKENADFFLKTCKKCFWPRSMNLALSGTWMRQGFLQFQTIIQWLFH